MFKLVILICAANATSLTCQPDTAYDVIHIPGTFTIQQCLQQGQTKIASGALTANAQAFQKTLCTGQR